MYFFLIFYTPNNSDWTSLFQLIKRMICNGYTVGCKRATGHCVTQKMYFPLDSNDQMCFCFFSCSIYKNDHNKWTGVPPSAGRHSWTGVHQLTASIHHIVVAHSNFWVVFPRDCLWLLTSCLCQDEYSIFPQTYSIDINGYILVYSVTSNKRFVWTHCRIHYAQCAELCYVLKVGFSSFLQLWSCTSYPRKAVGHGGKSSVSTPVLLCTKKPWERVSYMAHK